MKTEEMEKKILEALSKGNMEPNRLYNTGLQYVYVEQISESIKFTWFNYTYNIEDYIDY